ncbi:MAG TPA: hypothetical protein VFH44_09730 [Solirubrobacterales bacterium]|nr:hypothetical protein [Solirubrobacterales bacterium]
MTDDPGLSRGDDGYPGIDRVHIRLPGSLDRTRRFHGAIVPARSQPFKTSV